MAAESATPDLNTAEIAEVQEANPNPASPTVEFEGSRNESTKATTKNPASPASLEPSQAIAGSQLQDADNSLEKHSDNPNSLEEVNTTRDDSIPDKRYPEKSEIGSVDLIEEIRMLREKVSKIEGQVKQRPGYSMLQAEWTTAAETLGVEGEVKVWEQLMQGRRAISGESAERHMDLPYTLDLNHLVSEMNKDPLYESDVLRWRNIWERKMPSIKLLPRRMERHENMMHVIRQRNNLMEKSVRMPWVPEDSDSDGSLDFEYNLDKLRHRYLLKVDRLHEERDIRLSKKIVEGERKALEIRRLQTERRKEEELQGQSKKESTLRNGQTSKPSSNANRSAKKNASPELAPPSHAFPKLNRVDWIGFKALCNVSEKDSFAIDVLVGEPVIDLGFPHRRNSGNEGISQQGGGNGKQPTASTGQSPLPERIRLHSRELIRILDKLCEKKIRTHESLVIIRPFRVLTYYDQALRDQGQKLEKKLDASKASKTGPVEATVAEPENNEDPARPGNDDSADNSDDKSQDDSMALQHLRCLLEFIDTDISNRLAYLSDPANRMVFFSDVWHLFKPDDEVITSDGKQVYRVISVVSAAHRVDPYDFGYWMKPTANNDEDTSIAVHCVYIDFDGKRLGPVRKQFIIKRFDNEKSVTSLDVYPLRYHARPIGEVANDGDNESIRQKLITRGRKFVEIAAVPHRHMYYAGPAMDTREDIESQVVVDFDLALSVEESKNKNWRPNIEGVISAESKESKGKALCEAECCRGDNVHDDSYVDKKRNEEYVASLFLTSREKLPSVAVYPWPLQALRSSENNLSDKDMLIMSYRVFAFVLRTRKWEKLDLTHLGDIKGIDDDDCINVYCVY